MVKSDGSWQCGLKVDPFSAPNEVQGPKLNKIDQIKGCEEYEAIK
jgi:hypothetical protein